MEYWLNDCSLRLLRRALDSRIGVSNTHRRYKRRSRFNALLKTSESNRDSAACEIPDGEAVDFILRDGTGRAGRFAGNAMIIIAIADKYAVIQADSIQDLITGIEDKKLADYKPIGGIAIINLLDVLQFFQALIKMGDDELIDKM